MKRNVDLIAWVKMLDFNWKTEEEFKKEEF